MSIIESISKIYKVKIYNKAINNCIYNNYWQKGNKNKLQDLIIS